MDKWTRAFFQPGLGLGDKGNRITGCQEHIDISREAASEGMVLLKNDNQILPLQTGAKVALFGKGCIDYVKGGGGSGDVTVAYVRNLYEGLKQYEAKGEVQIFEPLVKFYQENVSKQYADGSLPGMTVEPEIPFALLDQAKAFADTAIISICRYSGEDWDRKLEGTVVHAQYPWSQDFLDQSDMIFDRGDFYLSTKEQKMVDTVTAHFKRVIVVLNVGGMVDTMWFASHDKIPAVLMAYQAGMEGGLAIADILMGKVNPSGKLTDTFAKQIEDYPSTDVFHENERTAEYVEDIFVGYRYFETVPEAKDTVNYPFGYGLSYTEFMYELVESTILPNKEVRITVDVTNVGDVAGKEVVQLYYGAPQGLLGKPNKELGAFAKTRLLEPGETQRLRIKMPFDQMASFDDKGVISKYAYVLEAGIYKIYLGNNVRDAEEILDCNLTEQQVVEQLTSKCAPKKLTRRMLSDGSFVIFDEQDYPEDPCKLTRQAVEEYEGVLPEIPYEPLAQSLPSDKSELHKLCEVAEGKISLDEFMDQLTEEELIHLTCGHRGTGVTNTGSMGSMNKYGIPAINTADGPAGLRIEPKCQIYTTAFPCATLLASTWNPDIVRKVGQVGAKEVRENNIGIWLTPGVNIHRSPLCGRNFEYYSEDPYLTGVIGTAMVQGIQSQHVGASVKHFACNNKETYRKDSDSIVSERALREIYLKAFEMIVKDAKPWTIMTSYNMLNGVHTSENKDLVTGILRDEWGFDGLVTSDWWTHAEHYMEIKAGNDIKMMNGYMDRVKEALQEGYISKEEIYTSAKRVLEMILKQD